MEHVPENKEDVYETCTKSKENTYQIEMEREIYVIKKH